MAVDLHDVGWWYRLHCEKNGKLDPGPLPSMVFVQCGMANVTLLISHEGHDDNSPPRPSVAVVWFLFQRPKMARLVRAGTCVKWWHTDTFGRVHYFTHHRHMAEAHSST